MVESWIFFLKFAPNTYVQSKCKAAFGGDVTLKYSIDGGLSWTPFATYEVWRYRKETFTEIFEEIPHGAHGTSTRFRWQQTSFDPFRDYWALDDVSISRYFSSNHRSSEEYAAKKDSWVSSSNAAQCCYLTEQCESNPEILLQEGDCDNDVSVHKDLKRKILDTQELILLFSAILIALHRGHQIMLKNLFENKALKKTQIKNCETCWTKFSNLVIQN